MMKLENIKNPKFLKDMSYQELDKLSVDIRKFLIENVAKTGGHLSSNLGIVELTMAIHRNFDCPKDKIIFDVGHQAYVHKILTGRAGKFQHLRQLNGLSGFQKMSESIYDNYEAGHSSTSLSAALGFALARDMKGENNNVIAIIGDGSIGNGLCYEALNHIGDAKTKLIVILNDNEMSISKNVGALHNTLDKIRSTKKYHKTMRETKSVLQNIPGIGKYLYRLMKYIKESFKKLYMKEGYLFEEFGLNYYGPINGHDFKELDKYLQMAKNETQPVLLHVITKKGKGYKYAEEDKIGLWHGVGPFDIETGQMLTAKTDKISWSDAIAKHLINIAKTDKKIIAITPAMANGSKLNCFKEKYPQRFIDVGIAEEHALVLANAFAIEGQKPFVSIYSTFLQRGYDEIQQDLARMNGNVVIGIDRAGIVGEDGETHQGIFDVAILNNIPNIIIMAPHNNEEAANLLYTAFQTKGLVAIRYSKGKINYQDTKYHLQSIGTWEIISYQEKRACDGYLISYGDFLNTAIDVQKDLKEKGIYLQVINARYIKPMDTKILKMLAILNKPIFVYEEVVNVGSLGSEIAKWLLENGFDNTYENFAIPDEFIKQGKREEIIKLLKLDKDNIMRKIEKMMKNANRS